MKKIISLCTMLAVTLSGCSLNSNGSVDEMPSDRPYNELIMETENGYYYNVEDGILSLRYTEKSNGADIFLCAKPECTHNGEDTCTATYQFMSISNTVLYNGSIYFVGATHTEDSLGYSLFRASLDGSALDKVGDVRRVKYPIKELATAGWGGLPEFRIHKGYAFIPYVLGGNDYGNYIEDGFIKMDITTGKTETIFSNDKYENSLTAMLCGGCGDHFYYRTYCSNGDKSRKGYFRYNVKNGKTERLSGALAEALDDETHTVLRYFSEKNFFIEDYDNDNDEFSIIGYSADTFEPTGLDFKIPIKNNVYPRILFYDDKIFMCGPNIKDDDGNYVIEVYSDRGELLGKHDCPAYAASDGNEFFYDGRTFDFSDNKLYVSFKDDLADKEDMDLGMYLDSDSDLTFYYCPVENIVAGTGEWTKAYSIKPSSNYWEEGPIPEFIQKYILSDNN